MTLEDHRQRLIETRDKLAALIEATTSTRDLPPMVREYRLTLQELEKLPDREKTSNADEIAARRARRRARRTTAHPAAGSD